MDQSLSAPSALVKTPKAAYRAAFAALSLLCLAALASALHPAARAMLRAKLSAGPRVVISTVSGDLSGDGREITVVKVKNGETLALEIYDRENGMPKLTGRVEIPNARDGYFNFNNQSTNLAIDDIDGDGKLEVLVPTFDANLVGQLNVFRYDAEMKSLKRVTAN